MGKYEKQFNYIGILLDELAPKGFVPSLSVTAIVDVSKRINNILIEININSVQTRIKYLEVDNSGNGVFSPFFRKLKQVVINHSKHGSRNEILTTVDNFMKEATMTTEVKQELETKQMPIEAPAQEEEDFLSGVTCDAGEHEVCESCQ